MAQLKATDPEGEPLMYGVSGEEAMRYFSVNKDTGVVWLRQQLDREVRSYNAPATVISFTQQSILFLKVLDKNVVVGSEKKLYVLFCLLILLAKLYCMCIFQTKSEMQVEFYVSDIQEVRTDLCPPL